MSTRPCNVQRTFLTPRNTGTIVSSSHIGECITRSTKASSLRFLKKWKKCKFQPQKMPMDVSEKNTIQFVQRITFRVSNPVKVYIVSFLSMRTVPFQNDRKQSFSRAQHVRFMKLEVNFGNANMSVIIALSLRCLYTVTEILQVTLLLGISCSYHKISLDQNLAG